MTRGSRTGTTRLPGLRCPDCGTPRERASDTCRVCGGPIDPKVVQFFQVEPDGSVTVGDPQVISE